MQLFPTSQSLHRHQRHDQTSLQSVNKIIIK